ncbi:MAG: glycosyltransferase [Lachnospiraceae bacterium]|nr:glycosyltransferase [Lachnospiraceae bacterium]
MEKYGYKLAHEKERRETAENGYRKVKAGHSIRARLKEILKHVTEDPFLD